MSKNPIRVAVVGVGNCCKSLVEGVARYSHTGETSGLAFPNIGGYKPEHIEFVLAYDVDKRKVGELLSEAIYAHPNCAFDILKPYDDVREKLLTKVCGKTKVNMGKILDGVAPHMESFPEDQSFRVERSTYQPMLQHVVDDLKRNKVDVLLNYLPVGSEEATMFYINACLLAQVPFVNCIPVFFVSTPEGHRKLVDAGIPAIGDDMRSQLGASVMSQALQELFFDRGMRVKFHKQTNDGGNTDFLNMMDQSRLPSKKISKENVIRSQNDLRGIPVEKDGIFAGPSAYVPYHGDNKIANFTIESEGFGGAPVTFTAQLSVQDSPNSAGVVIDAIRFLQVAREMGMVGSLKGPSAFTQKTPIQQMMFNDALAECEALVRRQWTPVTSSWNKVKKIDAA